MFLTLPASSIEKGQPLRINVTGGIFGKPAVARIYVGRDLLTETPVRFGYNNVQVRLPRVNKMTRLKYRIELEGNHESGEITQAPVRKWRVNFVQHSHTYIGYTRPQTEILAEHLRYIDYALDYCDLTDRYPKEAKFRWSCEASAVRTAAADLIANTAGMTMAASLGAPIPGKFTDNAGAANSALLFYTEHTVGYHGSVREGKIWNTFAFRGSTPAALENGEFRMEIRVFNTSIRIDLVYSIDKKMVTNPESRFFRI